MISNEIAGFSDSWENTSGSALSDKVHHLEYGVFYELTHRSVQPNLHWVIKLSRASVYSVNRHLKLIRPVRIPLICGHLFWISFCVQGTCRARIISDSMWTLNRNLLCEFPDFPCQKVQFHFCYPKWSWLYRLEDSDTVAVTRSIASGYKQCLDCIMCLPSFCFVLTPSNHWGVKLDFWNVDILNWTLQTDVFLTLAAFLTTSQEKQDVNNNTNNDATGSTRESYKPDELIWKTPGSENIWQLCFLAPAAD